MPSRFPAVRVHHGLQAFGQRRNTLDRDDAVARSLFDGLMNHGGRLFNKERAIGSNTAFRFAQHVTSPTRPQAGSRRTSASRATS